MRGRERAEAIVRDGRVKLHRFSPSSREIWTVVGSRGDHLVMENQPYCTCGHFYFSVLGGRDNICQHIEAVRVAREKSASDIIEIGDSEYARFLLLLTRSLPIDSSRG